MESVRSARFQETVAGQWTFISYVTQTKSAGSIAFAWLNNRFNFLSIAWRNKEALCPFSSLPLRLSLVRKLFSWPPATKDCKSTAVQFRFYLSIAPPNVLGRFYYPFYFSYCIPLTSVPSSLRLIRSLYSSRIAPFSSTNANNAGGIKLFGRFHWNRCESMVHCACFETGIRRSPKRSSLLYQIPLKFYFPLFCFTFNSLPFFISELYVRTIATRLIDDTIGSSYKISPHPLSIRLRAIYSPSDSVKQNSSRQSQESCSSIDFFFRVSIVSAPLENVRQIFIVDSTVDSHSMRKYYLIFSRWNIA